MPITDRVAIVGVAARFPGAGTDLARFWADVASAADRSDEVPAGRWVLPKADCLDPRVPHPDSVYSARGYFLDPFDPDPNGWNVPADLLAGLDPLFHLVLDVGHRAWASAQTAGLDRRRAGVVLGNICLPTPGASDLAREYLGGRLADSHGLPRDSRRMHPLNRYVAGLPAGLLAKALGLGGGTYTLDAACASSLYAIKLACDELLAGRADVMLAGGANGADSQYTQMGFSQLRALSQSGRCSPFDAKADGLMVGEGAGVYVLKRLSDALRDRDAVYAVIAGVGLSNDMHGNLLAPDKEGQLRAMRAAYAQAGWKPQSVDLIECHATGTPVGDAVEFDSLRELWGDSGWQPGQCAIGSVKSTVGHLLTGAGAAAVAKVLLAFDNATRPPQANFDAPQSGLRYDRGPFRVLRQAEPWEYPAENHPRRAAVSGFGFGGVNAHLLLEDYGGEPESSRQSVTVGGGFEAEQSDPVAVVGLAAHFGPWDDLRKYQEYVLGGGETPDPLPKRNGWNHADRDCPPGYFVESLTVPLDRFRIPPKELEEMLPQQLLMLQVAAAAIDDAGDKTLSPDPRTGVFVGLGLDLNTTNFHLRWAAKASPGTAVPGLADNVLDTVSPPLTADRTMGALGSIAASRIARAFQFGGPSFTVCSEETSAGRALELAVRALRSRELDRAVVGGVDLAGDPRALLAAGEDRRISRSGTASPLGLGDGTLPGEGAAALVLKRLADAERDGDRVYAVIRGVGSASGGPADGVAPDAAAYASSLMRACTDAVVDPATIEYLEAAATGADADDKPEAEALAALLSARDRPLPLAIGAVRGQVGNTGAASAAAGLVKVCLALHHQILPPTGDGEAVRDELAPVTARCYWSNQPRFWLADAETPRRAVVAATGVDGSVIHVVLEAYAASLPSPLGGESPVRRSALIITPPPRGAGNRIADPQPLGARPEAVFAIEADGLDGLLDGLVSLADFTVRRMDQPVDVLARDWLRANPQQPERHRAVTFVARAPEELLEQVSYARESLQTRPESPIPDPASPDLRPALRDRVFYAPEPLGPTGKIAFVFPGSGNHFPGMGRDLSAYWPDVLRRQQIESRRLRSQYAPDRFWAETIPADTTAKQFLFGQVALGTLTSDLLASLGVRADALIGQSLGESAGLFGMRVWTDRDEMLRRIGESTLFGTDLGPPYNSARRAYWLEQGTPVDWVSGVLAVPADKVRAELPRGAKAYVLIVTTPTECVVGGVRDEVEALVKQFDAPFFPLSGVTLAHCEAGLPVERPYRELHTLPVTQRPGLTVYSGAWGKPYDPSSIDCANSIAAGLVGPIDFPAVVEAAYRDGVRFFIEAGPGNSAARMVDAILGNRPHLARAVCAPRQDGVSLVLRLVADLIAERGSADLGKLHGGEARSVAPPRRTLTVPVGLPPSDLAPPPEPVDHSTEEEAVAVAVAAPMRTVESEPEPFDTELIGVAIEPGAELVVPKIPPSVPTQWTPDLSPFVTAAVQAQMATAAAHDSFLRTQAGYTRVAAEAVQVQNELVRRLLGYEDEEEEEDKPGDGRPQASAPPRSLDTTQCFEFARGKVGDVLGPLYAEVDTFPTRVRLPDGPLMLVDRILTIEGEPKSMTAGRVVTEHHVHADRWYLDAGRIPTCVAVESGQADLFLSGFLGIDFTTRGLAVYRLLDAVVTFHRGLPVIGDTIRYDIHIDQFFHQSDTWLFRFRFEATVNGERLMSMQSGVAGFFSPEVLAAGQGIVHTKLDRQPMPGKKPADWRELVPVASCQLSAEQVNALRRGELVAAFGPDFAQAKLRNPVKLPGGMLRLLDRVTTLDPAGGRFGLGIIRAEYDVSPDDWFLTCHFVDDMVMPGTLMYECCLHTLRVLLMRIGWVGEEGEVACEPIPGVGSKLKCRGQVIATTKLVAYEVSIKELGYGPEPYCVADALMFADSKPIVEIGNMTLRMTGLTKEKLDEIWDNAPQSPPVATGGLALYDSSKILAFSNGDPSEAFGEPYRVFDRDRVIARLPGPPYQFLDRITAVTGEPFALKAGAACEARYDVPPDAWYFAANRSANMPFSVLLEVALQPCGWLAAYCGSALTSDTDLKFRNLGGQATQFLPVTPDIGTLSVNAKMTSVSKSAGMIIQHYDLLVTSRRGKVHEGTTYFGFFSAEALTSQVGMPAAKVPALNGPAESGRLPSDSPFPAPVLRMVDRIDGYQPAGGRKALGLVRGSIAVDPTFWFFQAHFYQDPVWPGSLGLESFLQLLKYAAWKRWGDPGPDGWQTVALDQKHEWVYRGQVLPTDKEVAVVLEVTAVDDANRRMTADGFLTVDGRVIYQMIGFEIE